MVLVVPMDPVFLPEMALLTAGVFTGVAALRSLLARERSRFLRLTVASLACFALVLASIATLHHAATPPARTVSARP